MPAEFDADPPSALPRGTRLGEYELKRVLGIGGFGIVYLAFDHALEREVAIKEYMPASLAGRTASNHVSLLSQANAETFALGLRSFVNEARLLARFDHPALIKVHRYWEDYNTAYMAMPYYLGSNLKVVRAQLTQTPSEAWVRAIVEPLLGAIETLHREAVYHRDISPDNVIVQPDGRPVLLDLGAARRVISDKSMALTAILKPAYAPIEQYAEAGSVKQGPWTDLYSLGATMHYLLLGKPPAPATARAVHDDVIPLAQRGLPGCSDEFLRCIDWMLRPRPIERPQSVAQLREVLAGHVPVPTPPEQGTGSWDRTQIVRPPAPPSEETIELDFPPTMVHQPQARAQPAAPERNQDIRLEPTIYAPRPGADAYAPTMVVGARGDATPAAPAASAASSSITPPLAAAPQALAASVWPARKRWPLPVGAGALAAIVIGVWMANRAPAPPAASVAAPAPLASAAAPSAAAASAVVNPAATAAAPVAAPASAVMAPAPMPSPALVIATPAVKTPATTSAAAPAAAASRPVPVAKLPAATKPAAAAAEVSPQRAPPILPPPLTSTSPARAAQQTAPTGQSPAAESARSTSTGSAAPATSVGPVIAVPAPAATAVPTTAATQPGRQQPAREAVRDPEPMIQARVLSPSERCEGRVLLALWSCIERQCNRSPELREHAECQKLRRQQDQQRSTN